MCFSAVAAENFFSARPENPFYTELQGLPKNVPTLMQGMHATCCEHMRFLHSQLVIEE